MAYRWKYFTSFLRKYEVYTCILLFAIASYGCDAIGPKQADKDFEVTAYGVRIGDKKDGILEKYRARSIVTDGDDEAIELEPPRGGHLEVYSWQAIVYMTISDQIELATPTLGLVASLQPPTPLKELRNYLGRPDGEGEYLRQRIVRYQLRDRKLGIYLNRTNTVDRYVVTK